MAAMGDWNEAAPRQQHAHEAPSSWSRMTALVHRRAAHAGTGIVDGLRQGPCRVSAMPPSSPSPPLPPFRRYRKPRAHLRAASARTFEALVTALRNICNLFTPQECQNYFKAAGYAV